MKTQKLRVLGAEKAKEFADAYERNRPNQRKGAMIMDLENNKIGRELALDSRNKDKSDIEIVQEAMDKGLLLTQPPKIKGQVQPPQRHNPLASRRGITGTANTYNQQGQ